MKPKVFLRVFLFSFLSFQTTKGLSQATQATNAISSMSYLGTSNNNDVVFKRQTINAGLISTDKTSFGLNSFATANSISIGVNTGLLSSGTGYNTFIGNHSSNNTSGNNNIHIGYESGNANEGNRNIYIGNYSGTDDGAGGDGNIFIGHGSGRFENRGNKLIIEGSYLEGDTYLNPLIWGDFTQDQLKFNAKVGIGHGFGDYPTTAGSVNVSTYNLFVKGGILTEEVRVSLAGTWADYVFHKDYNLKSLDQVEQFITKNGHLPNVPSAKQVKENGIELGEMTKIQQEKIEELTLYVIEQNKVNEKQNIELEKQRKEIEKLKIALQLLLDKKK